MLLPLIKELEVTGFWKSCDHSEGKEENIGILEPFAALTGLNLKSYYQIGDYDFKATFSITRKEELHLLSKAFWFTRGGILHKSLLRKPLRNKA